MIDPTHTIARYFRAIDRADPAGVRSCFTVDVVARYGGRPPLVGIEALMASLDEHYFGLLRDGKLKAATHFMGQVYVDRAESEWAETETYALAFLVRGGQGSGETIVTRSLRYLDRLRIEEGEWRICKRIHTLDWSMENAATLAMAVDQRVMKMAQ